MARKRRTYTREFKVEAVKLVTEKGYSVAEAARSLGIGQTPPGREIEWRFDEGCVVAKVNPSGRIVHKEWQWLCPFAKASQR